MSLRLRISLEDDSTETPTDDPVDDSNNTPSDTSDDNPTEDPVDNEEEVPQSDNKPADLKDLNISELADNVESADNKAERKELAKNREEISKSLAGLNPGFDIVQVSAEQLALHRSGKKADISIENCVNALKFLDRYLGAANVGMESIHQKPTLAVATESLTQTIKNMLNSLIALITKAIEWIAKLFRRFKTDIEVVKKTQVQMGTNFMLFREKYEQLIKEHPGWESLKDSYVVLPLKKKYLTCQGKQPGSGMLVDVVGANNHVTGHRETTYPKAFLDLAELLKVHETFSEMMGSEQIDLLKRFFAGENFENTTANIKELATFITEKMWANPRAQKCSAAQGESIYGIPEDDRTLCVLYVRKDYLSDIQFIVRTNLTFDTWVYQDPNRAYPGTHMGAFVKSLAEWKALVIRSSESMTNGTLRYLETDEVKATNDAIIEMNKSHDNLCRGMNQLEANYGSLKKLLVDVYSHIDTIKPASDQDSVDGPNLALYSMLAKAINNLVDNSMNCMSSLAAYTREVEIAWIEYQQATMKREVDLLNS